MGDLECDAMLAYAGPELGAHVCIVNYDGINASIAAGNVTAADVKKALPFPDTAIVLEITGQALVGALETGLTAVGNQSDGQFPQIGGMELVVNYSAPRGSRVRSLSVKGVPVVPSSKYTIVTSDFLADGGYGYSWGNYKNLTKSPKLVNDLVEAYLTKNKPYLTAKPGRISGAIIARASGTVDGKPPVCTMGECQVGDLLCDALLAYAGPLQGAEVCIVNGGSIRESLYAGSITTDDVLTALPFNNVLFVIKTPGSTVLAALENGFTAIGSPSQGGRFPQIGGLTVEYDPSLPAGKRVVSATLSGKAIEAKTEYTLVTNDYLAYGGDGYTWPGSTVLKQDRLSIGVIVQQYLVKQSPYFPASPGRLANVR
jgi:2',3'-cyclic-nucleotide 2'-phosphodiesterase (5'-nucleotidase family)